jgi:prepilin peptidase CpaA
MEFSMSGDAFTLELTGNALGLVKLTTLATLVCLAAAWDARFFKIPNWLNGTGLIAGLALSGVAVFPLASSTLTAAFLGAGVAFACFFLLYALKLMGAGDVKLMAALGSFLGVTDILAAALFSFAASGLIGVVLALRAGVLRAALSNVRQMLFGVLISPADRGNFFAASRESVVPVRLPFGVAIAIGTVCFLALKTAVLR